MVELWWLFILAFERGVGFLLIFVIAGAMRLALHGLTSLTERIL